MEQEIRETLEKSKKSEEYQYALKVKSTIFLEWCLSQIAEKDKRITELEQTLKLVASRPVHVSVSKPLEHWDLG